MGPSPSAWLLLRRLLCVGVDGAESGLCKCITIAVVVCVCGWSREWPACAAPSLIEPTQLAIAPMLTPANGVPTHHTRSHIHALWQTMMTPSHTHQPTNPHPA